MPYPASLVAVLPGGTASLYPPPVFWTAAKDPGVTQTYEIDASAPCAYFGASVSGTPTASASAATGLAVGAPTVSGNVVSLPIGGGNAGNQVVTTLIPLSNGRTLRVNGYLVIQAGAQPVSGGTSSGTTSGGGGSTGGATTGGTGAGTGGGGSSGGTSGGAGSTGTALAIGTTTGTAADGGVVANLQQAVATKLSHSGSVTAGHLAVFADATGLVVQDGGAANIGGAGGAVSLPASAALLGTNASGGATAVSVGAGLALAGGILSATYSFTLSPATAASLGGIKAGTGLTVATDGTASVAFGTAAGTAAVGNDARITGAVQQSSIPQSAALLGSSPTGALQSVALGNGLSYSGGVLSAATGGGGVALPASAPLLSTNASGAAQSVSVGAGLSLTGGVLANAYSYTLPAATTGILGGVKVDGTTITAAAGVISATPYVLPTATTSSLGGVKAGAGHNVTADGTLSVAYGTTAGTAAQGNDARLVGALQASSVPQGAALLGSTSTGAFTALSLGAGLSASGGVLSAAQYTLPAASATTLGGVTVPASAVLLGSTASSGLTPLTIGSGLSISGGVLSASGGSGGAALPAGAPLIGTTSGGGAQAITLGTGLALSGTVLSASGGAALPASAALLGSNASGGAAAVALGGGLALAGGVLSATYALPAATTSVLGGVKPDGTTITASNGVISATPFALPTSAPLIGSNSTGAAQPVTLGNGLALSGGVLTATYSYTLPAATYAALGGVKPDGSTITVSSGVISAVPYVLPAATSGVLGGVKVDGTTITASGGVISAVPFALPLSAPLIGSTASGAAVSVSVGSGLALANGVISAVPYTLPASAPLIGSTAAGAATSIGVGAGLSLSGGALTLSTPIPVAAGTAPLADGTAAVGASAAYARADHVHPTDATRAPLASPVFTGSVTLPSWTAAPSTAAGVIGYNSTSGRYDFGIGAGTVNHVRLSGDTMTGPLVAPGVTLTGVKSAALLGTTGAGAAQAITLGTGLSLSGTTLNATAPASAIQSYIGTITCDGTNSTYPVTHNLNSFNVIIQVMDPANNNTTVGTLEPSRPTVNTASIPLGSVPPANTTYTVLCLKIG